MAQFVKSDGTVAHIAGRLIQNSAIRLQSLVVPTVYAHYKNVAKKEHGENIEPQGTKRWNGNADLKQYKGKMKQD